MTLDTVRFDTFWITETRAARRDELSPWLDSALVFSKAHSTSSWTVPAVASLLTGHYPNEHGAGRFASPVADLSHMIPAGILPSTATLAERWVSEGGLAAAFVAHPWFESDYGLDRGFDPLELRAGASNLVERAWSWIDEQMASVGGGRGLFVYLHFMEAHDMYRQESETIDEIVAEMDPAWIAAIRAAAPAGVCSKPGRQKCHRYLVYAQSVRNLRAVIATLLEGLSVRRLSSNTVLVVLSDHGEEFGEHAAEEAAHSVDPRGLYGVGHGHSLYQEIVRVPLLVWYPGRPGAEITAPVSLVDLVPSLAGWFGLRFPDDPPLPGTRLGEVVGANDADRALFASGIAYGPDQQAVRAASQKRIRQGDAVLAFDLAEDPLETSPSRSGSEDELTRLLRTYSRATSELPLSEAPALDSEALERLRALGYLDGKPD